MMKKYQTDPDKRFLPDYAKVSRDGSDREKNDFIWYFDE